MAVTTNQIGGYWWFNYRVDYKKNTYTGDVRLRINSDMEIIEWTFLHANPHMPVLLRYHIEKKIKKAIKKDTHFWDFLTPDK